MAATSRQVRTAIVDALSAVPGINRYRYPEDSVTVPAAVVSGFDMTEARLGGGRDITAKVLVVVSKSHTSQLELLDEMLDETGAGSVVAAINDRVDADDIAFWVTSVGDYGEFAWGGVDYYGALVTVRVLT
jgi:hypothetical protein